MRLGVILLLFSCTFSASADPVNYGPSFVKPPAAGPKPPLQPPQPPALRPPQDPLDLCTARHQLFATDEGAPQTPLERQAFTRFAKGRVQRPIHDGDTCGEELLTYLLERTPTEQYEALASDLGIVNSDQRELLLSYRFLLIEGTKPFNQGKEPRALLSFFASLQQAYDIRGLDKGLKVLSLQRSIQDRLNGRTGTFARGKLAATRVARVFIGSDEAERDSLDNENLAPADAFLMVAIHELAHGIFETDAVPAGSPFAMRNSSSTGGNSGMPLQFSLQCFNPDFTERPMVNVDRVFEFYDGLINRGSFTADTQETMRTMFRPPDGNLAPIRTRVSGRMPTQKPRFYGIQSHAEDWATAWEAYFYNSEEVFREGQAREQASFGTGLRRRFQYLAQAFVFRQGADTYTYVFSANNGVITARQAKVTFSAQGELIGLE